MGADTKYSVSLLIRFFYFLCHYLGAYQKDFVLYLGNETFRNRNENDLCKAQRMISLCKRNDSSIETK